MNGHTCSCACVGVGRQLCLISSLLPLLPGSPGIKHGHQAVPQYLPTQPSCGPLTENSNREAVTVYLDHQPHLVLPLLFLRLINPLLFAQVGFKLLLPQSLKWLGL